MRHSPPWAVSKSPTGRAIGGVSLQDFDKVMYYRSLNHPPVERSVERPKILNATAEQPESLNHPPVERSVETNKLYTAINRLDVSKSPTGRAIGGAYQRGSPIGGVTVSKSPTGRAIGGAGRIQHPHG